MDGKPPSYAASFYGRVLGRGGPHAAEVTNAMPSMLQRMQWKLMADSFAQVRKTLRFALFARV
jgi:hypothetical protein